jgi:histidine triad (HIT) family protein
MSCILCEISSRQAPASFVYEGEQVFGIISLDQPNPYKVIVAPRAHTETLYDLNDDQAAHIFQATVKIACVIREVSGCDGLNLVQSNGLAGQQEVFHFHLHLVPRFYADSIILKWDNTQMDRSELNHMAEEIRAAFEARYGR